MKFKVLFILTGVIILHAVILTGVCLTGGCKSPSVLGPRPFIAAPPPEEEITDEPVDIKDTVPKITMTTSHKITPKAMPAPPVFELGTPPQGIIYVVKKNDSFWKIAKKHGVTMQSLAAFNDMSLNKVLRVGEKLRIPPGGYVAKNIKPVARTARKVVKVKPQPRPSDGIYRVKSGDSFWKIAKRYNLKTKTLLDANNMTGKETLQIGQKLIIPDGKKSVSAAPVPIATAPKKADDSVTSILDAVDSPDEKSKSAPETSAPKTVKKIIEDIDDSSDDSERAVQVIKDIKVEDFAKQYKVTTAMLKNLNPDYPSDGIFKAGSVVIVRSAE